MTRPVQRVRRRRSSSAANETSASDMASVWGSSTAQAAVSVTSRNGPSTWARSSAVKGLASTEVNFCLIPEVPFDLHGEGGLLSLIEERILRRGHAVIIVSEGAGQYLFEEKDRDVDASGNVLHRDIGLLLKDEIRKHFSKINLPMSLKYIDPSYIIRSVHANASDAVFCENLARNAVHAGMAGKTSMLIGHWNNQFVLIPMKLTAGKRKNVKPTGSLWRSALEATGQGSLKNGE